MTRLTYGEPVSGEWACCRSSQIKERMHVCGASQHVAHRSRGSGVKGYDRREVSPLWWWVLPQRTGLREGCTRSDARDVEQQNQDSPKDSHDFPLFECLPKPCLITGTLTLGTRSLVFTLVVLRAGATVIVELGACGHVEI